MLCHSDFSHCDLVLPDGNLLGASDQGTHSRFIEGNPCGVAIRPPDYQAFGIRRIAIIETKKADRIIDVAHSQLGKAFDPEALRAFLSNGPSREWRVDSTWFCSELLAYCFEEAGYWNVPLIWNKNRVSPADFIGWFTFDPNWINRETFMQPITGLKLGPKEH